MPQLKSDSYTTDYIYSLPEGQRAELIDGVIYNIAPPNTLHQRISSKLSSIINHYIEKNKEHVKLFLLRLLFFLTKMIKLTLNRIFLLFVIKIN